MRPVIISCLIKIFEMKTTLIIHPKDASTKFLESVYHNIPNKTVITGGVSKEFLLKEIENHQRIMMMGHGTASGLFSVGQFKNTNGYIIDSSMVSGLTKKKESIFIWCNADQFVLRHQLTGFYTGMFISEVGEACYCGLPYVQQEEVDESNFLFVNQLGACINNNSEIIYNRIIKEYGVLLPQNKIAAYNHQRLYLSIETSQII